MNRFNQTLGLLDETARASGRTVSELVQQAREEDRLLHEMVERFEKRFTLVTALFVVVLIAVTGAGGYALYKMRSSPVPPASRASRLAEVAPAPSEEPAASPISPPSPIMPEAEQTSHGTSPNVSSNTSDVTPQVVAPEVTNAIPTITDSVVTESPKAQKMRKAGRFSFRRSKKTSSVPSAQLETPAAERKGETAQ